MEFLQQVQPVLQVLQWVVAISAAVFMLYMKSIFATKADMAADLAAETRKREEAEGKVRELEREVGLLKRDLTQGPTANDVHELRIGMERLSGQLGIANERMSGLEDLQEVFKRQVELMNEWMRQPR